MAAISLAIGKVSGSSTTDKGKSTPRKLTVIDRAWLKPVNLKYWPNGMPGQRSKAFAVLLGDGEGTVLEVDGGRGGDFVF